MQDVALRQDHSLWPQVPQNIMKIQLHAFQTENERFGSFSSTGKGVPMIPGNITQTSQSHIETLA